MYFFYFDESGSRDPKAVETFADGTQSPKEHIYSLTAVGLFEGRWRRFDREIANLKLELSDHLNRTRKERLDLADCEVKSNWIRNPKERGANSRSRSTAFLQWCRSHMSHTMMAVCPGDHCSALVVTLNSPEPGRASTRFCKLSSSAGPAADAMDARAAKQAGRHTQRRKGRGRLNMDGN